MYKSSSLIITASPNLFSKVTKNLYRGGAPTFEDLYSLKNKQNINKIVSLDERQGNEIDQYCKELGLDHIILGLGDGNDPKISILKKKIIPELTEDGPTYIHCFHGKDRTGMAVAMFRLLNGWSLSEALTEAWKFGMGKGLSKNTKQSYYNAVKQYSKELDNNQLDAVTLTRETNPFGNKPSDSSQKSIHNVPSFNSPISDIEDNITRQASNRTNMKSKYFTDLFNKLAAFEREIKKSDKKLEEEDSNDILDVGLRDSSVDAPLTFPGSSTGIGGMPDGAAGTSQMPFSGQM